jgi:hypothetical protein
MPALRAATVTQDKRVFGVGQAPEPFAGFGIVYGSAPGAYADFLLGAHSPSSIRYSKSASAPSIRITGLP